MKTKRALLSLLAFSFVLASCGPTVTVSRVVPAPYNLGAIRTIVLVESHGLDSASDRFAIGVVGESRRLGFYEVVDARSAGVTLEDLRGDRKTDRVSRFRHEHPADVFAQTEVLSCGARMNSEAYTDKEMDKDGNEHEVKKTRYWYGGECEVHVTLVDARDGHELASFGLLGQDASSKTDGRDTWRESIVAGNALSHAVDAAVARFTPHRVNEAIDLDKKAPLAKEGIKLVDDGKYAQARSLGGRLADPRELRATPLQPGRGLRGAGRPERGAQVLPRSLQPRQGQREVRARSRSPRAARSGRRGAETEEMTICVPP